MTEKNKKGLAKRVRGRDHKQRGVAVVPETSTVSDMIDAPQTAAPLTETELRTAEHEFNYAAATVDSVLDELEAFAARAVAADSSDRDAGKASLILWKAEEAAAKREAEAQQVLDDARAEAEALRAEALNDVGQVRSKVSKHAEQELEDVQARVAQAREELQHMAEEAAAHSDRMARAAARMLGVSDEDLEAAAQAARVAAEQVLPSDEAPEVEAPQMFSREEEDAARQQEIASHEAAFAGPPPVPEDLSTLPPPPIMASVAERSDVTSLTAAEAQAELGSLLGNIQALAVEPTNQEQAMVIFNGASMALLGITAEEFSSRWDAGQYASAAKDAVVHSVAKLRPAGS